MSKSIKWITSVNNLLIKEYAKLKNKKYRNKLNLYIVEEVKIIEEAIKYNCVKLLISLENFNHNYQLPEIKVNEQVMRKLSENTSLNQVIAIVQKQKLSIASNKILILDQLQNPGNVGNILRLAKCFGYRQIYLRHCADIYDYKCLQAAKGANFSLDINYFSDDNLISNLKNQGYQVIGTSPSAKIIFKNFKPQVKHALILGNEGHGINQDILNQTSINLKIEIEDFDSLSVTNAAAIFMYQLSS